ncbi:chemotaxis response regulator protein-glutamate methylesterase [Steroidobacter flavus]|uniref:Protein-glutamate methylesterase/protein-glutamine glutaminase n=1 Tax=Steroidobacter flavus TaxID=1842136 RepID=A0ABV8SN40_9GAMM
MIVDDSAVVRQVVSDMLTRDPQIQVIAAVSDPVFALERLKTLSPDVIVLDVEMPRMDGITFLRRLMSERPTPVVMCSSLTEAGAATTLDALAAGAVAIVTKPKMGVKNFLLDASTDIIAQVKAAASANVKRLTPSARSDSRPAAVLPSPLKPAADAGRAGQKFTADAVLAATTGAMKRTTERIVAIGTSTGGTQALEAVLKVLPKDAPGIIAVQHMPERFTAAFADRLNKICQVTVREATTGERLLPGHVLIAPGGKHLMLKRSGAYYYAEVLDGALVNRHKPSVDVLFRSVANCAGPNAMGVIMTGMGDDGARGLKEMRESGSSTLAQDEASCVVFGMPKEAIRLGGAQRTLPLNEIAGAILLYAAGA